MTHQPDKPHSLLWRHYGAGVYKLDIGAHFASVRLDAKGGEWRWTVSRDRTMTEVENGACADRDDAFTAVERCIGEDVERWLLSRQGAKGC